MKRILITLAAYLLLTAPFAPGAAQAHDHGRHRPRPDAGRAVDVWYEYDDGSRLPAYDDGRGRSGARRFWLEAVYGRNYRIGISNLTGGRIGVVVAVDGRNIVSGEKSDLLPNERMYVLDPWQTVRLDGWRTSNTEVHRFFFTAPGRSYTERAFGDRSAMGVIGVAVFREIPPPPPPEPTPWVDDCREGSGGTWPSSSRSDAAPAPGAAGRAESADAPRAKAERKLGTGFGRSEYSPVRNVSFEPEGAPAWKGLFKYETRRTLCRKGIVACGESPNRLWDDDRGFAPHPAE